MQYMPVQSCLWQCRTQEIYWFYLLKAYTIIPSTAQSSQGFSMWTKINDWLIYRTNVQTSLVKLFHFTVLCFADKLSFEKEKRKGQTWEDFICQATVTLHQGQDHQNKHEHIYAMHKSSTMPSLNATAEILSEILLFIIVKVLKLSLRLSCDLAWMKAR